MKWTTFANQFLFLALVAFLLGCGPEAARVTTTALPTPTTAATAATASPTPTTTLTAAPTSSPTGAPSATTAPSATPSPTATTVPTPPAGPLSGAPLVAALRSGGYVIYFRHAATDPVPDDAVPVDLADCATQRNLSEEGRAQAAEIGQAFERLGIPVSQVLSSPFCRALDTARLAFGRAESDPLLENLETAAGEPERQARIDGLRRLLSTPPEPGTNTVLAGHGFNINAAANESIPEGGAVIFRPEGEGAFSLVATVTAEAWGELAAD